MEFHRLASLQPRQVAFRKTEIDHERGQVFDRHDLGAVLDVIADVDASDPGDAVEGCRHTHPPDLGLRERHLRQRDLQRRGVLVDGALADEVLRGQLPAALQIRAGDPGGRLGLLELRLLQGVVELQQQLALAYPLAVCEAQFTDPSADLGAQRHALARPERADRLGIVFQTLELGARHLDRGRSARARPPLPARRGSARVPRRTAASLGAPTALAP